VLSSGGEWPNACDSVSNYCVAMLVFVLLFSCREEYLAKIEKRIKSYDFQILNEPRPDKLLLVLDIDYTLFGE